LTRLPSECITNNALRALELCNGVPSRTLTSNLEFRTLPLFALSYGDEKDGVMEYWSAGVMGRPQPGERALLHRSITPPPQHSCSPFWKWYARPVTLRNSALI